MTASVIAAKAGGGKQGNSGRSGNTTFTGNTNTAGAAKRPKGVAQEPPPRPHCHPRGSNAGCASVRDHRTGGNGLWHPNTQGPAGGPNNRKPPS
jgi:hypothetical protein